MIDIQSLRLLGLGIYNARCTCDNKTTIIRKGKEKNKKSWLHILVLLFGVRSTGMGDDAERIGRVKQGRGKKGRVRRGKRQGDARDANTHANGAKT